MSPERVVIDGPDVPPVIGPYSPGVRAGDFLPHGLLISIGCVALVE